LLQVRQVGRVKVGKVTGYIDAGKRHIQRPDEDRVGAGRSRSSRRRAYCDAVAGA
jgi:hypothetical protein